MAINLSPDYSDLSLPLFIPSPFSPLLLITKRLSKVHESYAFSAWYDERTSGALSTFLKPLPTACCLVHSKHSGVTYSETGIFFARRL